MGLFENQYPYTDFHELNLNWVIEQVQSFEHRVDNISEDILNEAKAYTDSQLQAFQDAVTQLTQDFNEFRVLVNNEMDTFKVEVRASIGMIQIRVNELNAKIDASVIAVNARTDEAIAQNNEYLLGEIGRTLGQVKVINYFTGAPITIQAMFDYLAQLHATNGITFTELANKSKTFTEYAAYNMSYEELAREGKIIIV